MDLSTSLHITEKGEDEVRCRAYKLNLKKRSVLNMLDKPKPVEHVLAKSVFPRNEIIEEIEALIRDGFISLTGNAVPRPAAPAVAQGATGIQLDDEIVLSEAKFMLTDFSVDSFGTQSQVFVDAIRACKSVEDLRFCLNKIFAETEKQCPNRLPMLVGLVVEINETA